MNRALLWIVPAVCAIWLSGMGCNGTNEINGSDNNGTEGISKEELIERLNRNSESVRVVVSLTSVEIKNSEYPDGQAAEATFAFMKPSGVGLFVTKANVNVLIVKSDGEVFDVIEFRDEDTRCYTGRVEFLESAGSDLLNFRPDMLSAAMALERIEPEDAEMCRDDSGNYVITTRKPGEEVRKLFVSSRTLLPVAQEICGRDGNVLLTVSYDRMKMVETVGNGEAYVPSALTITDTEGNYLKIENSDPTKFRVNDEKAFWRAMGHSARAVMPEGAEVRELQRDGTWRLKE
jgi:hypothetical protein